VILVDTAALYALLDTNDPNHGRARDTLERLRDEDARLLAHEYVLVEATALVQRRLGLGVLRRFLDDLLPLIEIIWIDPALHAEAREALLAGGRRDISLVDWVSFLVMRRHGLRQVFTFDSDFADAGFALLPAP
jgi:predicted nucleic acid-binding protein